MRKYVGITIGPICDTIGDVSSPAALWFASSLFSDITRRICEQINKEFLDATIYSPYYGKEIALNDGVGKFHDRIIFSTAEYSKEKMEKIIEFVKEETVTVFPQMPEFHNTKARQFFKEYLQIHFVVRSEEQIGDSNCVLVLSPYLDALELMKTFPKDDSDNPIRKLFLGEEKNGNKYIKNSELYHRVTDESNQLKNKEGQIWTIDEIANCHNLLKDKYKRKDYYAVVSADGDGMGKFLQKLTDDNKVTDFSKCCLKYAEDAAKLIGRYGGMTIYAGGDDLLFLAPVMTATDNIFNLCNQIQKLFREKLANSKKFDDIMEILPTISFGISIQYKKFPLYEALDYSRNLLSLAKVDGNYANEKCKKNNMMVEVQKHSGQSLALLVGNEENSYNVFQSILNLNSNAANEQTVLQSMLYTLDTMSSLFTVLNEEAKANRINFNAYKKSWENFFDNSEQKKTIDYIDSICQLYYENFVCDKAVITVPDYSLRNNYIETDTQIKDDSILSLIYLLKLKKFLTEEEGQKNEVSGKDDTP